MVTTFNRKDLVSFGNYILRLAQEGMKQPDPSGNLEVTHADIENWMCSRTFLLEIKNPSRGVLIHLYDEKDVNIFESCRTQRVKFEIDGMSIDPWDEDNWFWEKGPYCEVEVGECPCKPWKEMQKNK